LVLALLLLSAQAAIPPKRAFAMTEQDLTIFAEVLLRLDEMLNKPAIAVASDVCGALRGIIGSNVVSDATSRFFRISGQEIVNWYGGDEAVVKLVKDLGLFEKAADND
jgi:hypothetical protein